MSRLSRSVAGLLSPNSSERGKVYHTPPERASRFFERCRSYAAHLAPVTRARGIAAQPVAVAIFPFGAIRPAAIRYCFLCAEASLARVRRLWDLLNHARVPFFRLSGVAAIGSNIRHSSGGFGNAPASGGSVIPLPQPCAAQWAQRSRHSVQSFAVYFRGFASGIV